MLKSKGILALSAFVVCSLVGGCSRPATLTGQLFVVTKGRDNVKLGLVEVIAVPEQQLKAFQDEKVKALLAEYDAALLKFRPCKEAMSKMKQVAEAERATLLADYKKNCAEEFGRNLDRMGELAQGSPFLEALPTNDASTTKTDADGRYTLTLLRGARYAIAARAERTVPGQDKPEQYRWLLWAQMDGEKNQLLLSNDNMMTENPADAVVRLPNLRKELIAE